MAEVCYQLPPPRRKLFSSSRKAAGQETVLLFLDQIKREKGVW
jgi:hypothetical protein